MSPITELGCPSTGAERHQLGQSQVLKFWTNGHVAFVSLSGYHFQIAERVVDGNEWDKNAFAVPANPVVESEALF